MARMMLPIIPPQPVRSRRFGVHVRGVHQIEITSRCNLRCAYCTHPIMPRPKIDMDRPTFEAALRLVKHFVDAGTQHEELNVAGIGESTLHPDLPEYLLMARDVIGPERRLVFATNGIAMTDELARALVPAAPSVYVSAHRPEKARPAMEILARHGLLVEGSLDPVGAPINWAGQVEWAVETEMRGVPCPWIYSGRVMVMADGRITSCCFDSTGEGVVGDVNTPPAELFNGPWRLCDTCHHAVVEPPA